MKNSFYKRKLQLITIFVLFFGFTTLSQSSIPVKTGVLVMAHGGGETWNAAVQKVIKPLKEKYPTTIAFGMAQPKTMQAGIDRLEAKGINKIIIIPLFISSHSIIIRQAEYLIGMRDTLADPPLLMSMHGHGYAPHKKGETMRHNMAGMHTTKMPTKKEMLPLHHNAKLVLTKCLDASPYVAQILQKRILEMSKNPGKETIILVAHGPNNEKDNTAWIGAMENLSQQVQKIQAKEKGDAFKQVFCVTLRDDANKTIYNQAKNQLRALVRQAGNDSRVIVVPLLLSSGGIEKGIVKRLQGLKYDWNGEALLPSPLISDFLLESVKKAL